MLGSPKCVSVRYFNLGREPIRIRFEERTHGPQCRFKRPNNPGAGHTCKLRRERRKSLVNVGPLISDGEYTALSLLQDTNLGTKLRPIPLSFTPCHMGL